MILVWMVDTEKKQPKITLKPNPQQNCSLKFVKVGQTRSDLFRVILENTILNLALCIILIE